MSDNLILYFRMFTLASTKVSLWGNINTKYCLVRQSFVQFETLAKNQNVEQFDIENWSFKPLKPLKAQSRCDLPLGSKRVSFISRPRTQPIKQQKMLTFQNILNENQPIVPSTYLLDNHTQVTAQTKPAQSMTPCLPTPDPPLAQSSAPPSSTKPPNTPGPNLEMVAYQLTQDLTNIFMQRQEWSMYHKEVVLQDNIRGEW